MLTNSYVPSSTPIFHSHAATKSRLFRTNINFEDDVYCEQGREHDLKRQILRAVQELEKQEDGTWDMLLVGWISNSGIGNKDMKLNQGIVNVDHFGGMHAYVVSRKGAKACFDLLESPANTIEAHLCSFVSLHT